MANYSLEEFENLTKSLNLEKIVTSYMSSQELKTEIFGKDVNFEYAEHWVGYSLLAMRVGIGWILLQGGLQKLLNPSWTAAGYLSNVPAGNPFVSVWSMMAAEPFVGIVNILVIAGLIFTGIGIMLGAFTRLNAFFASLMMMLFWASSLEGGLLQGLPVAHGWVVDSHIVYTILIIATAEFGAGRLLGLDKRIEETSFVEKHGWVKHFLTG